MPISSQVRENVLVDGKRRPNSYWPNHRGKAKQSVSVASLTSNRSQPEVVASNQDSPSKDKQQKQRRRAKTSIKHISNPSSLASTSSSFSLVSMSFNQGFSGKRPLSASAQLHPLSSNPAGPQKSTAVMQKSEHSHVCQNHLRQHQHQHQHQQQQQHTSTQSGPISLGGQTILTGRQPNSLVDLANSQNSRSGFLVSANVPQQFGLNLSSNSKPLASSTASGSGSAGSSQMIAPSLSSIHGQGSTAPLNIKRAINLKYIKTLIVALMFIDLLITVFVHQFSTQDQLSFWLLSTSIKFRFSTLNLILSSIWFIVLVAAILFDIYFILVISFLVQASSFVLLLVLSVVHFSRRIDYNSVELTSLLGLLFSIIILHVYLLVMAALTAYLMIAIKRRRKSTQAR